MLATCFGKIQGCVETCAGAVEAETGELVVLIWRCQSGSLRGVAQMRFGWCVVAFLGVLAVTATFLFTGESQLAGDQEIAKSGD